MKKFKSIKNNIKVEINMAMAVCEPACGFGAEEVKRKVKSRASETVLVGQSAFLIHSFFFFLPC